MVPVFLSLCFFPSLYFILFLNRGPFVTYVWYSPPSPIGWILLFFRYCRNCWFSGLPSHFSSIFWGSIFIMIAVYWLVNSLYSLVGFSFHNGSTGVTLCFLQKFVTQFLCSSISMSPKTPISGFNFSSILL